MEIKNKKLRRELAKKKMEEACASWSDALLSSVNIAIEKCEEHCMLCDYCTAEGPFNYDCDGCKFKPFRPW